MVLELNKTQQEYPIQRSMIHSGSDGAPTGAPDLRAQRCDEEHNQSFSEGKPAVLSVRRGLDQILADPRRWVATPGKPVTTEADSSSFWVQKLLQLGRANIDGATSSSMLWDKLKLNVPRQLSESILNLKNLDDETARAAQSALIGTFNSSFDEGDLEAAAHALSVFLNTHPLFSHMAAAVEFDGPFGADVAYELVNLGIPEA